MGGKPSDIPYWRNWLLHYKIEMNQFQQKDVPPVVEKISLDAQALGRKEDDRLTIHAEGKLEAKAIDPPDVRTEHIGLNSLTGYRPYGGGLTLNWLRQKD